MTNGVKFIYVFLKKKGKHGGVCQSGGRLLWNQTECGGRSQRDLECTSLVGKLTAPVVQRDFFLTVVG
jgi:hypothetical protein